MADNESKIKTVTFFDGINALVCANLAKPQELLHAENMRSPLIGSIEKREGYTVLGTITGGGPFVSVGNYGVVYFQKVATGSNTGLYRISSLVGSPTLCNIYYLNTSNVWTILGGSGSGILDGNFDKTIAEDDLYLVNYNDKNRYILGSDGTTVYDSSVTTGNLYQSPRAKKINYYKNRLYIANYRSDDGLTTYPTTILRSSPLLGIVSLVNGDPIAPYGSINVTDTKYIYTNPWVNSNNLTTTAWAAIAVADTIGTLSLATAPNSGNIWTSGDGGVTWTNRTSSGSRSWTGICISADGTKLAACVGGGFIYTSTDSGATWNQRASSLNWNSIACSGDGSNLVASITNGHLYNSTDSGATWTDISALGNKDWTDVAVANNGNYMYATANSSYIQFSSNNGASWADRTNSSNVLQWSSVSCDESGLNVAATAYNDYIYTSSDRGVTWTKQLGSGKRAWVDISMSYNGQILIASTSTAVYISSDYGVTWSAQRNLSSNSYLVGIDFLGLRFFSLQQNSSYALYSLNVAIDSSNRLEVYRGSFKVATIRVISVDEISITNHSVVFENGFDTILSADELWAFGTFNGKKQFRWAKNPSIGGVNVKEYDTFKLTSDDGSGITMLTNIGNMLMIANKSSLAAWNDYIITNFDTNAGCVSDKGFVKVLGTLFFIHYTGIYATTGGAPQLVSSKVEPYFSGATKSGLENSCAGRQGRSAFFTLGDVTLYKQDGSVNKVLKDVVLEYSVTQENWFVYTGIKATEFNTFIKSTNPDQLVFSSNETNFPVCEMFSGNLDNGREISSRTDLNLLLLPSSLQNIAYPSDIIIESDRGSSSSCFVSLDGGDYYELIGNIKKGLSVIKVNGKDLNSGSVPGTLPRCRRIGISIRDSSKQRNKLTMCGIKYTESPEVELYKEKE